MDIVFCESVIINFLFMKPELRERTISYVTPEIFDIFKNKTIIKTLKNFWDTYNKMPSLNEMMMEIPDEESYNHLKEILDIDLSEFTQEYLLHECETFFRQKLTVNCFSECSQFLQEAKFEEASVYPDKIRESLAFSFDTKLGMDFFEDEERIYEFLHNKDRVVPFGLKFLDMNTKGGAHEKSLTLFMAETNLGKTLILTSLASNAVRHNKKVLYITCEMSENKISERILANLWDHDINELNLINKDYFHRRFEDMKASVNGRVKIKEFPPATINSNNIRNLLKEYEVKQKFAPDIIYLDYLELVKPTYVRKGDNSYNDCKRTSEEIRAVAVDYALPIVSAVQSNRAGIGASELSLSNVADSVGIAFTGDVVFSVTQSKELLEEGKFSVMINKNRYGLNKIKGLINVDKPKMKIFDCDDTDQKLADLVRKNAPTSSPAASDVKAAIEVINETLDKAQKASDESVFGDWE